MIGIVMATRLEAEPLIGLLSLEEKERRPFPLYSGKDVVLVLSGIGKARSAVAASYLAWKYGAGPLVNLGAAGGTGHGLPMGETYIIEEIIEYDRPALSKGGPRILRPDMLEGFPGARLATQDHAVTDPAEREEVGRHADLVDMEAAAFVQACRLFERTAYVFKTVTDTPDHADDQTIVKNIREARDGLCAYFAGTILPAVRAADGTAGQGPL